jgi:hypothetical protein
MKKQIILPLSLLLSFVTVRASDVSPEESSPVVEASAEVAVSPQNQPAPVAEAVQPEVEAIPAVQAEPAPQVVAPVAVAPVVQPAPAAPVAAPTVSAPVLPTEADINSLLGLVNAYNQQSSVLKSLHDLASNETVTPNLPNEESVRSLLHLLELHKREADLITALRASIASVHAALSSIQASVGQWDADVASLVTKHKKAAAKQKVAKRSLDFGAIKDMNKPKGHN